MVSYSSRQMSSWRQTESETKKYANEPRHLVLIILERTFVQVDPFWGFVFFLHQIVYFIAFSHRTLFMQDAINVPYVLQKDLLK